MDQRNIRIYLTWLCGSHGIKLLPWDKETLAIGKDSDGKFTFYVYENWLFSSDQAIFEILEGGFYHEALGHGRHTTFDDFKELETSKFVWSPLARHIHNILEDIFIETQAMKIYPTVQPALSRTVELLVERQFFGDEASFLAVTPANLLTSALLCFCRGKLLPGQDIHLQPNMDILDQLVPSALGDIWDQVWDIAKESVNAKSSMDTALLTREIMSLLKDIAENEPEKSNSSKDEIDSSDSDSPGQNQQVAKEIFAAKSIDSKEMTEVISEAISDAIGNGQGRSGGTITEVESIYFSAQPMEALKIASITKSASNDLEELLLAETYTKYELLERGSRIDRKQLVRGASGLTNHIFAKESKGGGLSTAIFGLFDYSGSMRGEVLSGSTGVVACDGIMTGLGEILDEFDVPYEFAGFSDVYMTIKAFEADGDMFRRKRLSPSISGGTITGGAAQIALSRLACRREEKKILLIVTDGDTSDLDLLVSCYNEAKYMGIQVASVMLGALIPSIKKLSDKTGMKAVSAKNLNGLGRFLVDQVKAAI